MPEYSSTTLTPTNETKVPAMQNNSSGNFQLDALKAYILAEKAQANGLASLDATGKLVSSQIPDNLDDVLVYGSYALLPATGVEGKIYITADTNSMYRWDASLETPDYVMLAVDLEEYATKAELQAETNQRKASDSRLESRLENLEQKAGDYTTVQYRGTDAVPTGKAKNGLVEKIVGKSRAWNQLQKNGDFSENAGWGGRACSVSIDTVNKIATLTVTSDGTGRGLIAEASLAFPIINGHKYYLGADINAPISTIVEFSFGGGTLAGTANITANVWNSCGCIISSTLTTTTRFYALLNGSMTTGQTIQYKIAIVRDLTLIFGADNEPSTVADVLAQLPSLGQYNAYDAGSLVDTEVSGAKSVGVNIWDEEWVVGNINSDGTPIPSDTDRISTKNYIPILPNKTYYVLAPNANGRKAFFDKDKNLVSFEYSFGSGELTTPSNAFYMKFCAGSSYGATYQNNIQICDNSLSSTLKTTYHPYKTDTLSLPSPVTLRSAGSVADTDELNVEVLVDGVKVNKRRQTTRVGSYTFTGNETWTQSGNGNVYFCTVLNGLAKGISSDSQIANIRMATIVTESYSRLYYATATTGIAISNADGRLCISASDYASKATLIDGKTLNYELAAESVTLLDPIENNTIKTEGGGTIETIQTQNPVIDNCLDVGYLTL